MNKVVKYVCSVAVISVVVLAITTKQAGATALCDIPKLKLGELTGQHMVAGSNSITATFKVSGDNCTTPVTLAVWNSPSANGQPINDQTLFAYTTKTFGPGTHSITTKIPDCYFQADLLVGSNPVAADGTANYSFQNGQIVENGLRDWKYGGDKECKEPEEPEIPEVPTEPQTLSTNTTKTLPATGAGALATTFVGVTTSAGLAHAIVRRFRK